MKNMKKILALVVAALMLLSCTAMAATVTVTGEKKNLISSHTFTAYQILTGSQAQSEGKLGDLAWGNDINAKDFYNAVKADTTIGVTLADFSDADPNASALALGEALNGIASDSAAANRLAVLAQKYLKSSATGTTVTDGATVDVAKGYYLIVDQTDPTGTDAVNNAALLQVTDTLTIKTKTDKPSVDKDIITTPDDPATTGTNEEVTAKSNNAAIGDTVTYKLTSAVPDMTYYRQYVYVFHDTMSKGLTYNPDSLSVKVVKANGTVITLEETTTATEYSKYIKTIGDYSETNGTAITVNFNDLKAMAAAQGFATGDTIVVTYSATVNDKAEIGTTGNPNTVYLEYSNNPDHSGNGIKDSDDDDDDDDDDDHVTGKTPDHKVITYLTGLDIKKVDKDGKTLTGAKFKIEAVEFNKAIEEGEIYTADDAANPAYYQLTDGTYTSTAPTTATANQYVGGMNGQKYKLETKKTVTAQTSGSTKVIEGVVGSDGILSLDGLKKGTYTITELVAPTGYNLLKTPIVLEADWTAPTDSPLTDSSTCTWTWTKDGTTVTDGITNGVIEIEVINQGGSQLPETGGIGTTIFYVLGSLLAIGAVILLVTKKRMGADD